MTPWTAVELVRGAGAGVAATGAMSVAMFAAQRAGLLHKLPPENITEAALDTLDVDRSERTEDALTTASHFAYGAACGALFGLGLPFARRLAPATLTGALFGAAVWAVSYAGWVPAMGILPPPTKDDPRRQGSMLGAHLVFGGVLGWLLRRSGR
jgi:hypothetical protein